MSPAAGRPWALVTGGGRRIGRALVDIAADVGFNVCVHVHRSEEAGDEAAAALKARGVRSWVVTANLADADEAAALIPRLATEGRAPSLLVNNAAIFEHDRLASTNAASFDRHMAVNLRAPLLLAQAFAAALPEGTTGHIVSLVDQRVHGTSPHYLSYSLAKAGLWSLTRRLAVELAPRIRVNALAPGITLPEATMSEERAQRLMARFPLGEGGSLADLSAAFRFLLEAPTVTGEMICVDGGAHLASRAE